MSQSIERILWSIAIPGFGQLLNGKYLKGVLFIAFEFLINLHAHLNEVIMLSFLGRPSAAVAVVNFQWLMFYPCVYMYAIWDAYRDAGGNLVPYGYLPFVLPAYLGTVGVIYSPVVKICGVLLGPMWLPMLLAFVGVGMGIILRDWLNVRRQ
ncbi:hypothetical protein [Alicyclobacillus suci]|uniref:hypothetical protein n=1 Tax=Alicyclobacillus suci TaxID=2816080 RepID=UPI0011BF6429|nr:hypothetical protein [Alicyclobacillus suci]